MRFFRRSKIGFLALILLSFPAALVWMVVGGKSVEAGLTSGTAIHGHSGITTGGSVLTRPNLTNASTFTLSTSDDTTDFAIATSGLFGKVATSTVLGTVGLYLDAGNVTDDGLRSPTIANYSDGANIGFDLRTATVDGLDNAIVRVCPTGECTLASRGARITLHGNETTSQAGLAEISAGNATNGLVRLKGGSSQLYITENDSSITLSTALSGASINTNMKIVSTASCAAGYTRISATKCHIDGAVGLTSLVRDACTLIQFPADGANQLGYLFVRTVATGALVGGAQRESLVTSYSTAACATDGKNLAMALAVEFIGSILPITSDTGEYSVRLNASGAAYVQFTDDTGNTGSATYSLRAYDD